MVKSKASLLIRKVFRRRKSQSEARTSTQTQGPAQIPTVQPPHSQEQGSGDVIVQSDESGVPPTETAAQNQTISATVIQDEGNQRDKPIISDSHQDIPTRFQEIDTQFRPRNWMRVVGIKKTPNPTPSENNICVPAQPSEAVAEVQPTDGLGFVEGGPGSEAADKLERPDREKRTKPVEEGTEAAAKKEAAIKAGEKALNDTQVVSRPKVDAKVSVRSLSHIKPKPRIPNGKPPPDGPCKLHTLPPELLFYIAQEYLDPPSIVYLSLACRNLRESIPNQRHRLTREEKFQILKLFGPPIRIIRNGITPYPCIDCGKWHDLADTALWPDWAPEATYLNFEDFADPKRPRVCVQHATSTGRWNTVRFLDGNKNFLLCERCGGPYSIALKKCSWHCDICRRCDWREGWSALCKDCTQERCKPGKTRRMRYTGYTATLANGEKSFPTSRTPSDYGYLYGYVGSSVEARTSGKPEYTPARAASSSGSLCSRCLGRRVWDPYSAETCRCFSSERSELPGNTRMIYDGY